MERLGQVPLAVVQIPSGLKGSHQDGLDIHDPRGMRNAVSVRLTFIQPLRDATLFRRRRPVVHRQIGKKVGKQRGCERPAVGFVSCFFLLPKLWQRPVIDPKGACGSQ